MRLPALGFDVVDVDVLALFDIGDDLADVLAVFDDGVAGLEVLEGDFMAEWNVHQRFEPGFDVAVQRASVDGRLGLDVHHGHSDVVLVFVN